MDWFPLQYWRSKCPEIVRVSSKTSRTRHETLGLLCDLWSWASTETETGRIPGVHVVNLPDLVGADAAFWSAVVDAGWLADDGGIVIPGWDHWLSESAKKRTKDAFRKRNERSKRVRETSEKRPKSVPKKRDKTRTTVQDSTEQKKTETPPPPSGRGNGKPPRLRDELFDAIAEVTGTDPGASGSHVGKVAAELRKADPPYTADEVRQLGAMVLRGEACDWAVRNGRTRPTLGEVEKYIGQIRAGAATPPPPKIHRARDNFGI